MSENRVIGANNGIPWHIPDDFRWFKECTENQIVVLGRKTYDSLKKKPLPRRENWVLTHRDLFMFNPDPLIRTFRSLEKLEQTAEGQNNKQIWICGGAEIYKQYLPRCRDLFLTKIKRTVTGDRFFPEFENIFTEKKVLKETDEFKIVWYVNSAPKRITQDLIEASFPKDQENIEEKTIEQLAFSFFNI